MLRRKNEELLKKPTYSPSEKNQLRRLSSDLHRRKNEKRNGKKALPWPLSLKWSELNFKKGMLICWKNLQNVIAKCGQELLRNVGFEAVLLSFSTQRIKQITYYEYMMITYDAEYFIHSETAVNFQGYR